jgi:hypothetical protein
MQLADGGLLCSFLSGPEKSHPAARIFLYYSADQGISWTRRPSPSDSDVRQDSQAGYLACHITELADHRILAAYMRIRYAYDPVRLFHPITNGIQPVDIRLSYSDDQGLHWTEPFTLVYPLQDILISGKIIRLSSGQLGLPCEIWHEWDRGFRQGPAARLILSDDQGLTWTQDAVMASDPAAESIFGDPRLICLGSEALYASFWRYNLSNGRDMTIHASWSCDHGRHWSPVIDTGIVGQIANPIACDQGVMGCVYQDRFDQPGIHIVFSYDQGLTWDVQTRHALIRAEAGGGADPFQTYAAYSFGYASVIRLADRRYCLIFWRNGAHGTEVEIKQFHVTMI